jgi:hypothetical protein
MVGKLLLISDLEGCIKQTPSGPQSTLLCSDEFFRAVKQFLEHPENKVAFLGDYFDQGPYVVDSINSIMDLQREFTERVIIIVGNRDINKMRLAYEMRDQAQSVGKMQWSVWSNFYTEMSKNPQQNAMDRLKLILTKSMGAVWPPQMDESLTQVEAGFLLVRAFSKTASQFFPEHKMLEETVLSKDKFSRFVKNCKDLFLVAKIVHKDETFNTLLSHAGGADSYILHSPAYYDTIRTSLTDQTMTYYDKIEKVRLSLQLEPAPEQRLAEFIEDTYNAPLRTCVQQHLLAEQSGPDGNFFLIQGLGLKPNANEHFVSFVQSCDNTGCKGPQGPMSQDYSAFLRNLETNSGIKVIAAGHAPHCAPLPLIYKRQDAPNILFVANDTSNGYRPAEISAIEHIPLSYISKDVSSGQLVAGVFSLPGTTADTYKGKDNMFESLVGTWNLTNAPELRFMPHIFYGNGKQLLFPAREHTTIPGIFTPALMKGGAKTIKSRKHKNRRVNKTTQKA